MLYERDRNYVLPESRHRHEVGADRTRCRNCRLAEIAEMMSPFEIACWNWYHENVNEFTMAAGAVGELIHEEGLTGVGRRLFMKALAAIHCMYQRVSAEKRKAVGRAV